MGEVGGGIARNPHTTLKRQSWEPDTTLVALTRQGDSGEVAVSGLTRSARFQVNGLELRWDFGLDDDGNYEYAFVIQPDRTGLYYDLSRSPDGTASPRQTFDCEQSP